MSICIFKAPLVILVHDRVENFLWLSPDSRKLGFWEREGEARMDCVCVCMLACVCVPRCNKGTPQEPYPLESRAAPWAA